MKKTFPFAFFLAVTLSFVPALKILAQNTPVSLNLQNVKLELVLNDIEKQTNYLFVYNRNIDVSRLVSVSAERKNLREVLTQLFAGTDISFAVEGMNIVLSQKTAVAKGRTIEGKVTNSNGDPLPGVSVMVKGTVRGTVTGANGTFTLKIEDNASVLQLSFLGLEPKDVSIGNQSSFNIIMSEDNVKMDEIVVTALGITKESKSLAYNVQTITSGEITTVKDANFINALAGKVAGMTINTSSTGVGGSSRVVLRGTKSLTGNNNALYVIDGIPMPQLASNQPDGDFYSGAGQSGDGISNINPEDIESMSVLSGPAASALYGGDAANGVIVITTKKGSKDGVSVTYSNNTMFFSPFVMPRFQNTYGLTEQGSYFSWGDKLETPSSYNPKDFFRTGFNTTHSITLSGGNERSQNYVSIGSVTAGGIIPNNDFDRYNVTFRNTSNYFNDKLTVDVGLMYSNVNEQNMLSQGQYSNPLIPIYLFPPGDDIRKYQTFERYDTERFIKTQFWPFGDQGYGMQNPWWITERNLFQNHKNRYLITGTAKYRFTGWFNVTGRVKLDNDYTVAERKFYASTWTLLASDNGFYSRDNTDTRQMYADVLANFEKSYSHYSISANIGASIQDMRYDNTSHGGKLAPIGVGVPNLFSFMNISQQSSDTKYLQSRYHDQLQSVFATAQVGYRSMVYLDLSGRNEWPSQLAGTSRSSYFYPSAGLSAIVTDLLGIRSKTLTFLKLRATYSEVGNPPDRYLSLPSRQQSIGVPPSTITDMPFDVKPERTRSWEAGVNLSLWGNKIKIAGTVYRSMTLNQIIHGVLSPSSGYSGFYINAGHVSNEGIEASLGLKQRIGHLEWNSTAVFSLNRNRIDQLIPPGLTNKLGEPIEMTRIDLGGNQAYRMYLYEGGTMSDLYVNKLKTDDHGYIYVNQANYSILADQGIPETYAGRMSPDYNLSWQNGFTWKNLDLSCLISARVGGVGLSLTQALMDGFGTSEASAKARDGQGVKVNDYYIPAYNYYSVTGSGQGVGSMYVYDATNVRISEVSIGYTIFFGSKVLKSMNLSLVGRNLFMIYCKAPFDPETTASTGTYFTGIDYFMQPSLRSVGFAVKLSF